MSSPMRRAIEVRSAPILQALVALPRWVLFLALVAAVAGGLLLTGVAAFALLGTIAVFLAWLAFLAWPVLTSGQRVLRALTVLLVAAAAVARLIAP
ncbi:hypothetical protein BH20ACT5_BH20ACT5_20050 [soil metagenome]